MGADEGTADTCEGCCAVLEQGGMTVPVDFGNAKTSVALESATGGPWIRDPRILLMLSVKDDVDRVDGSGPSTLPEEEGVGLIEAWSSKT